MWANKYPISDNKNPPQPTTTYFSAGYPNPAAHHRHEPDVNPAAHHRREPDMTDARMIQYKNVVRELEDGKL